MIKSILVALDKSASSQTAKKLAVELSKKYKSSLSGIGVLDEPWIVAPEAIPLGGAAFKVELDEQLLQKAKQHIHKLEKSFMDYCKKQDVSCSVIDVVGVPSSEIEHYITGYDILIIGKDADFHFNDDHEPSLSIQQLLKDNPRPIIATSPHLPNHNSSHILVGFDGSLAASRALHMALLLGIFKNKTVHIVSVSPEEKEAHDWVNAAAKLCKNHGIKPHIHPITSSDKASKAILNLADDLKPSLLVLGAYGHSRFTYFFTGSCAKDLIKESEIPFFIYH